MDGGVSVDNIHDIVTAGANIVVAGSAIFGKDNIQKSVSDLRYSAEQSWRTGEQIKKWTF